MSIIELAGFVFVVVVIFVSPFLLSKILSRLRLKLEPSISNHTLGSQELSVFKTKKDNIRYSAIAVVLFGLLSFIVSLLNDLGSQKIYILGWSLLVISSALGIWKRQFWGLWIIGFSTLAVAGYFLYLNPVDFVKISSLLVLMVFWTVEIGRHIRDVKRIEAIEK